MPNSQNPAADIGCLLCGTPTRVDGPVASCPTGHQFEVIYGDGEDGRPSPMAAGCRDGGPPRGTTCHRKAAARGAGLLRRLVRPQSSIAKVSHSAMFVDLHVGQRAAA
jgi:hypothetical protein